MSSSKDKGKDKSKEKGKGIRRAEGYQLQVPTKNEFLPLTNFPPLPYKAIITKPSTKPTPDNSYYIRHSEHLFLTNYKTIPSPDIIKPLIKGTFGK